MVISILNASTEKYIYQFRNTRKIINKGPGVSRVKDLTLTWSGGNYNFEQITKIL